MSCSSSSYSGPGVDVRSDRLEAWQINMEGCCMHMQIDCSGQDLECKNVQVRLRSAAS